MSIYNDDCAFTVRMDPSYILMCMTMWRDALDMKMPLQDGLKVHFITSRRHILEGYAKTSTAWDMLLDAMQAEGPHQVQLDECRASVKVFKEWTKASLAELDQMAMREEMYDALHRLAFDPAGSVLLKRMLDEGAFKQPPDGKKKGNT